MLPRWLILATCTVAFAACESESSGPSTPTENGTVEVNATSTQQFTYFSFASGSVVTVQDPTTSDDWDLAFRRYEVRLNGGVLGAKGVAGYNLANNASATSEEVLAFTPDNQQAAFDAVAASSIPAAGDFVEESLNPNPVGWVDFSQGAPTANSAASWKVRRGADGGYAVFHATALTFDPEFNLGSVTVEWRYQPPAGTLGTAQQVTLTPGSATAAVNFATGATSDGTSGCGWDIKAGADYSITTNAGCEIGTFPVDVSQSFSGLTRADDALQYGTFLAGLSGAIPFTSSLDNPEGPFLYDLAGDHRLSPTFNIYLIRVGSAVYKVQLTSYYNATGASGYPTIRYAKIQ